MSICSNDPSTHGRSTLLPQHGNMAEAIAPLLDNVDRLLIAGAPLAGDYDETQENRDVPEPLIERVAFQAPFGKNGKQLDVKAILTSDGSPLGRHPVGRAVGSQSR